MVVFVVLCVIVVETKAKAKAKSLSHSDVETTVSLHSRDMHFFINFVLHFIINFVLHLVSNFVLHIVLILFCILLSIFRCRLLCTPETSTQLRLCSNFTSENSPPPFYQVSQIIRLLPGELDHQTVKNNVRMPTLIYKRVSPHPQSPLSPSLLPPPPRCKAFTSSEAAQGESPKSKRGCHQANVLI